MSLTAVDEPATVDAFGVRFTMSENGRIVRCHVVRAVLSYIEERAAFNDAERLEQFDRNRKMFETMAAELYGAGHRTPCINVFGWERAVRVALADPPASPQ